MLVAHYDKQGKTKEAKINVEDSVFKAKINPSLLAQVVETYLANQRQSNADVNDRGEVRGGGRKPWKQKGTGRARVGSSRSPLWKGGGKTFGPSNEINYTKQVSKKMRKAAIRSSLSAHAVKETVVVFEDIKLADTPKTQDLIKVLKDFGKEKVLIIQSENNQVLLNAAHNLENVSVEVVNEVNAYDLLKAHKVIILEPALEKMYSFWGEAKATKKVKKVSK